MAANTPDALLRQLCHDLNLMWRQAGGPTVRVLSGQVGLGKSQVSAILNGKIRRLPDWDVIKGLVDSFRRHADEQGCAGEISLRTGVEEYWRPRYTLLAHAFEGRTGRAPARAADADSADSGTLAWVRVVPRQLPPTVRGFTGRAAQLQTLTGLLDQSTETGGTVVIAAIDGMAGIGKSALAVCWARRVADRFPDGQLYANLLGFDPIASPLAGTDAVRAFLEALGVPGHQIPVSAHAQVGLYRSLLAGRRVLIILDNARDAGQVRPLLPGTSGCLVLATSRNQLIDLVATEGAYPVTLNPMTATEARNLFVRRIGVDRVNAESEAVNDIVTRCARLPLALAIVAAHAAAHPDFPLAVLATKLARAGLDVLAGAESTTDVRAVFSWSYRTLSSPAARLFRLLALHPGPDVSAMAAASLAGIPPARALPLLADLVRAHLLIEHSPGRFSFHDLLRAYAGELARSQDSEPDRLAAVHRVLDHYLHTAQSAVLLPYRDRATESPPQPAVTPERLTGYEQAREWFAAERAVLLAVVDFAAGSEFGAYAWLLADDLAHFFDMRGLWHDQVTASRTALAAARRLGDRRGQAHAHRALGRAFAHIGHQDDADDHHRRALDLYHQLGDHIGQAVTHYQICSLLERLGRYRQALEQARHVLHHYCAAGDEAGQARALNAMGWCYTMLGEHRLALAYCVRALSMLCGSGDRFGQAMTWDSIGRVYRHLGNHRDAIACYQRAAGMAAVLGHRYLEARARIGLGDASAGADDMDVARREWWRALRILDDLHLPDATYVLARLTGLATPDQHDGERAARSVVRM
jgi:tetratricopeptide (TPR) repeat protein